jgi:hypothetical protein
MTLSELTIPQLHQTIESRRRVEAFLAADSRGWAPPTEDSIDRLSAAYEEQFGPLVEEEAAERSEWSVGNAIGLALFIVSVSAMAVLCTFIGNMLAEPVAVHQPTFREVPYTHTIDIEPNIPGETATGVFTVEDLGALPHQCHKSRTLLYVRHQYQFWRCVAENTWQKQQ